MWLWPKHFNANHPQAVIVAVAGTGEWVNEFIVLGL
jgi:hypothetical protein